jgi:hypothetical protein
MFSVLKGCLALALLLRSHFAYGLRKEGAIYLSFSSHGSAFVNPFRTEKRSHRSVTQQRQRMGAAMTDRRRLVSLFLSSSESILDANTNGSNNAEEIARQLRQRAQDLRREALAEEQSLKKSAESRKEADKREADAWIDVLLGAELPEGPNRVGNANLVQSNIPSAQTLAQRIKEHQLSSANKLMKIVERLHDREKSMIMGPEAILSKPETIATDAGANSGGFVLGDYENNSLERKIEETSRIAGLLDRLLEAVQLIDEESGGMKSTRLAPNLRIRVTELRKSREALLKRRIDGLIQSSKETDQRKTGFNLEDLVRSSMQGETSSDEKDEKRQRQEKMMKRLIETPLWLAPSLASFAATSPVEVPVSCWKMIKSDLLAGGDLICTSWDATDVAAVFRLRIARNAASTGEDSDANNQISAMFNKLLINLQQHPELGNRVQLFLTDDNEWRPSLDNEEDRAPPVIIGLAREVVPEQASEKGIGTKSLAAVSTLSALVTTLGYALSSFALSPAFFNSIVNENDVTLVPLCLPIFFGVWALIALHELGHFATAKKYDVKLGFPVPLPSLHIGSFGCITPMRSFPSTRTAMFDVAMSGPGMTMIASLLMIVAGLVLTQSATSFTTFPLVPAAIMKSSFLIGSIASWLAPKVMLLPLSQPIPIHPLFLIGLAGLVMSAVNLLPIGRLDGGRACVAAFGRRAASATSFVSLLAMAIYSFSGFSGVIIFFGALVVMTQRLPDIPAINEVEGVSAFRSNGYIGLLALGKENYYQLMTTFDVEKITYCMICIFLALMTLAPFPGSISPI